MDIQNQIELELYFADHFDTILYPVLADLYFQQGDLRRARKVCEIGLKHHENDSVGLYMLAQINKSEGKLYLYDQAQLNYLDTELKSGIIILNYNTNEVTAGRIKASVGNLIQSPIFTQG